MTKKIKILLIGANGIVGTTLSENLNLHNFDLTVVSRKKPTNKIHFVQHSADKKVEALEKKIKKNYDTIIINSGYINETVSAKGQANNFEINVKYIFDILELAKSKKVKKIIYTSTLSFLQKPFLKTITEEHPVALSDVYAAAKYIAESAIVSFCKENKIEYFCFRIPSPVNTDKIDLHNNVLKLWSDTAKKGNDIRIFGKGDRHQNFLNTKDIAEIYKQVIRNKKKSGIYNLAATSSISMKELAKIIVANTDSKIIFDKSKAEDVSYKSISIKKLSSEFDLKRFYSSKETIIELVKNQK